MEASQRVCPSLKVFLTSLVKACEQAHLCELRENLPGREKNGARIIATSHPFLMMPYYHNFWR